MTDSIQVRIAGRLRAALERVSCEEDRPLSSAATRLIDAGLAARGRASDVHPHDDATWRLRIPFPIRRAVARAADARGVSPGAMVRHLLREALAARGVVLDHDAPPAAPSVAPAVVPSAAQKTHAG